MATSREQPSTEQPSREPRRPTPSDLIKSVRATASEAAAELKRLQERLFVPRLIAGFALQVVVMYVAWQVSLWRSRRRAARRSPPAD